jgi:hypothetical protein
MLGIEELKESIEITETTVECPFKGCIEKNRKAEKSFQTRREIQM